VKLLIEDPIKYPIDEMKIRNARITIVIEINLGTPFLSSHKKGGRLIIEINAANRNGVTIDSAAFIPAIIIIDAAMIIRDLDTLFTESGIKLLKITHLG